MSCVLHHRKGAWNRGADLAALARNDEGEHMNELPCQIDRGALKRTPTIVGHRGSPRHCTENTVASVRRALAEGAAAVQVDLCRTRDGRLVLWRDDRPNERLALARQLGLVRMFAVPDVPRLGSPRRRAIGEMDLEQMRETHCYHRRRGLVHELMGWRPRRTIPFETLEDLLSAAPGMLALQHLYLNLRLEESLAPEVYRLAARLSHYASTDGGALMFHVMSPHRSVVEALQLAARRGPGNLVSYAVLSGAGFLSSARSFGAHAVACRTQGRAWSAFRRDLLDVLAARERGEIDRVVVWTVNDPGRLADLLELGPDAVLTDDIPLALRLIHPALRDVRERFGETIVAEVPTAVTVG